MAARLLILMIEAFVRIDAITDSGLALHRERGTNQSRMELSSKQFANIYLEARTAARLFVYVFDLQ
jgi:hypothetical protein